jgi:hypothetical protein
MSVQLDAVLPSDLINKWQRICTWYQIVGSTVALEHLEARHKIMMEKRSALLREAQTERLKKELIRVNAYIRQIEEGLSFHKVCVRMIMGTVYCVHVSEIFMFRTPRMCVSSFVLAYALFVFFSNCACIFEFCCWFPFG